MEDTCLCLRLIINVLIFLAAEDRLCCCAEKEDAAFLRVFPNELQFFVYDSIVFDCVGFDEFTQWRVMRSIMGIKMICGQNFEISSRPCVIQNAFPSDSGEYWCEANATERSNAVNISVTAGHVILEIPAFPVMVGETVTLSCRNKTTSPDILVDFYKDGNSEWTNYDQNFIIHKVSKSDEGLYKCVVNGAGESAESWLAVRESGPSHRPLGNHLWITVGVCLLMLVLSAVGLHAWKHREVFYRAAVCTPHLIFSTPRSHQTEIASRLSCDAHPQLDVDTYNPGKMIFRDPDCESVSSFDQNISDDSDEYYNIY